MRLAALPTNPPLVTQDNEPSTESDSYSEISNTPGVQESEVITHNSQDDHNVVDSPEATTEAVTPQRMLSTPHQARRLLVAPPSPTIVSPVCTEKSHTPYTTRAGRVCRLPAKFRD